MLPAFLEEIETIVGKNNLLTSAEDRIAYSYDGTQLLAHTPEAIVIPRDTGHVSEIVKMANREKFAIVPRGSGTGLSGGAIPQENSIILLMNHWDRILEIDQENLTAWVQPGVITADFHAAVENIGLFYPPDPGSMSICTIGGNVGENAGGLRGLKYGVTKNYVMGLEVVLPTGDIAAFGGKTVKDVAGYNMKDLFVGSEGTLGIFTKILLKLIPKPQSIKTMLAIFDSIQDAANTVSAIIASRIIPATLEFLDNTTIRCVEDYARIGLPVDKEALLLIEADGYKGEVEEDAHKIMEICRKNHVADLKIAKDEQEADTLKTARRAAFSALARSRPTTILEDATVPRNQVAPLVMKVQEIAKKYNVTIGNFGHAGDGNLHPTGLTDERDSEEIKRVEQAFEEIFEVTVQLGGTITGEHGVGLAKKQFLQKWLDPGALGMMRKMKEFLDPNNILNPGKIFDLSPRCEGKPEN
ncbi:MAG: FAD-linked oxidase C-terminal domain-containing protein [Calditrichia bacterium]